MYQKLGQFGKGGGRCGHGARPVAHSYADQVQTHQPLVVLIAYVLHNFDAFSPEQDARKRRDANASAVRMSHGWPQYQGHV